MKTAKELELSLLLKEKTIQDLKLEKIHLIENGLRLRKRINKAIEYIEQLTNDEESIELMDINSLVQKELLKILKGVDKE